MRIYTVSEWLSITTANLSQVATERIKEDILNHVQDFKSSIAVIGLSEALADEKAVEHLGDPVKIAKKYEKIYLTKQDEEKIFGLTEFDWYGNPTTKLSNNLLAFFYVLMGGVIAVYNPDDFHKLAALANFIVGLHYVYRRKLNSYLKERLGLAQAILGSQFFLACVWLPFVILSIIAFIGAFVPIPISGLPKGANPIMVLVFLLGLFDQLPLTFKVIRTRFI